MACTSLVALPRACGAAGVVGGIEKLYMVSFVDLAIHTGSTTNDVYTVTTGGTISAIALDASKKFVEVGLLKETAGLTETLTKTPSNGTAFFTQNLTVVLGGLTPENRAFVQTVLNQPVAIIIKTKTGKYFAAGLNGQFELSAAEGGTGVASDSLNGYTLTFSGVDGQPARPVDETIISDITV